MLAIFLWQGRFFGVDNVIANCSGNLFSIFYLGFLSSFILGIRIDFGLWAFLMFIFTVKFSDIGAYTAGRLFGKHKFSPVISPKKTWEGLVGAIIFASLTAVVFSLKFNIMNLLKAVIFGAVFAVLGQLGDLAESMIKRNAMQKDSGSKIPGFGGLLDVLDSPIATAAPAYLFLKLFA